MMATQARLRKLDTSVLQRGRVQGFATRESRSSSLARAMRAFLTIVVLLALFSLGGLLAPARAHGATWPVGVSASPVGLGFKQIYRAGETSYAHSGIDIPASAGLQIVTPLAGTVRFTGVVPSGDSRLGDETGSERTMRAVSVQIADGRTVTLMPFSSVEVGEGQRVSEGEVLGTLAASGDVSSVEPHLHMGLKDGSGYYDPLSLFSTAVPEASARVERDGAFAVAPALPVPQEPDASMARQSSPETGGPSSAGEPAEQWGTVSSGDVAWAPHQEHHEGILAVAASSLASLGAACAAQAADLLSTLNSLVQEIGVPGPVVLGMLAIAVAGAAGGAVLAAVHTVKPIVDNLWKRKTTSC